MLSHKQFFMIILLASFILFTVTDEFVYAIAENQTSNINLTNNIPLTSINNITNESNVLETLVNEFENSITQISQDFTISINNSIKHDNNTEHNSSTTNSLNAYKVNAEFQRLNNIPYNEKSMNCGVKSKLFAQYLYSNGGKEINLVVIVDDTGKYSHEFVEWNGHYYDACNQRELSYTVSEDEYLQQLRQLGFTGLMITSPYPN